MISYETFYRFFTDGEITKLNFICESKEYVIARDFDGDIPVFVFECENQEPVLFDSAEELFSSVTVAGLPLKEIWYVIEPLCNDSLADMDYVVTLYGDTLGKAIGSTAGTVASHERYATQYFLPSLAIGLSSLFIFLICTLFVKSISWAFFGVAAAVIAGAFAIAQVIFYSNTKRYRQGNPRAHFYLLNEGAVILSDKFEYAIPYEKIIRLETEADMKVVTLRTVFSFTPNCGSDITDTLRSIFDELKAIKTPLFKKKRQRSNTSR